MSNTINNVIIMGCQFPSSFFRHINTEDIENRYLIKDNGEFSYIGIEVIEEYHYGCEPRYYYDEEVQIPDSGEIRGLLNDLQDLNLKVTLNDIKLWAFCYES